MQAMAITMQTASTMSSRGMGRRAFFTRFRLRLLTAPLRFTCFWAARFTELRFPVVFERARRARSPVERVLPFPRVACRWFMMGSRCETYSCEPSGSAVWPSVTASPEAAWSLVASTTSVSLSMISLLEQMVMMAEPYSSPSVNE